MTHERQSKGQEVINSRHQFRIQPFVDQTQKAARICFFDEITETEIAWALNVNQGFAFRCALKIRNYEITDVKYQGF